MEKMKNIWQYPLDAIIKGYTEDEGAFQCIICGKIYKKGNIYSFDSKLVDAYGAINYHNEQVHGMLIDYLLDQELSLTGISDIQRQILRLLSAGKNDKEIALEIGIAQSTVRNHRFKMREKEKQAKLYLAMMQSLQQKISSSIGESDKGPIEEVHQAATMVDERYGITAEEKEKALKTYMDENGGLKQFPAREKKKIIVLTAIAEQFNKERAYSELEINEALKRIYEVDYVAIRRALIEYGFMERSHDCKVYHVKY